MVNLDVRYYDKTQAKLLGAWTEHQVIRDLCESGLGVDPLEFLTYTMFHEQKNFAGWRTIAELKKKVPTRAPAFCEYFDLDNGTIASRFIEAQDRDASLTERAGEAAALLIANKIFGLHEGDWERIPTERKRKTLDFARAAVGGKFIRVEAKGAVVENPEEKSPTISNHKASIEAKKAAAAKNGDALLGVIAAIPAAPDKKTVCWLVDPPSPKTEENPRRHQLLARMSFYLKLIAAISGTGMAIALRERVEAIAYSLNFEAFSGRPLRSARGRPYHTRRRQLRGKAVFKTPGGGTVIGRLYPVGEVAVYLGLDWDAFELMAEQDHDAICGFRSELGLSSSSRTEAEVSVPRGDVVLGANAGREVDTEVPTLVRARVSGRIASMPSGLVTGLFRVTHA